MSTASDSYKGHVSIRIGPRKVAWSDESYFTLHYVDGHVCVHCLPRGRDGTRIQYEKKASWQRLCDALGNVLLGNLQSTVHVDVT